MTRLDECELTLDQDAIARGRDAAADPPSYLTDFLGPVPSDSSRRAGWERKAGRVEQHRAVHDITDPGRALGVEPSWNDITDQAIEHRRLQRQASLARTSSVSVGQSLDHGPELGLGL